MECYQIKELSFRYPDADKDSLHELSFTVQQGEFLTVCGLSGSGKSTLLRQLKTALQPHGIQSGSVCFEGKPLHESDLKEQSARIGFVLSSPDNQSITDKVWHELSFGLENLGVKSAEIQRRTAELASFFGIEAWFEKPVEELSGGEKQLLNLAAVLIMRPSVLILDEPLAQLDPIASEKFVTMLKKINTELGTTIIMSSHDLETVCSVSSRIMVLSQGRIAADGTPQALSKMLFQTNNPVFLSLPSPARLYEWLDQGSKPPLSVAEGRGWLESYLSSHPSGNVPLPPEPKHTQKPCLQAQQLWFRYEKNGEDILKGLSLSVYRGEFLTILGGNGTGKTTLLSILSGCLSCYRGKLQVGGKHTPAPRIAMLPQDPQTLFVRQTVEDELWEMLTDDRRTAEEQETRLHSVIDLCRLHELLPRHPYDLSGGEQQRAALAKLLLTDPEILLLDEPTKNLDTAFKQELSKIIRTLCQSGTAVVSVSHDLEFCASHADRCVMLFHGKIVSDDHPKRFFSTNGIYTTSVCRLTHGLMENTVTVEDVLEAFSLKPEKDFRPPAPKIPPGIILTPSRKTKASRKGLLQIGLSILSLIVFLVSLFSTANILPLPFLADRPFLSYPLLLLSAAVLMLSVGKGSRKIPIVRCQRSFRRSMLTLLIVLVIVPATVIAGVYLLDDSKYLFISLLVMLESSVPFFILFEKRNVQARELVILAALCALCVAGRAVFYMLPAFKPVTALVIISAAALGGEAGFLIGSVSMLASNIFFGQGIWTPWQMLAMGLIGFLAGELFRHRMIPVNRITLSLFGFLACYLIYGGIMNPATLILSRSAVTPSSLLAVYGFGLPIDTVHAVSTAVFLFIGAEAFLVKLERIKLKYGLISAF